jgi:hypothetical protein
LSSPRAQARFNERGCKGENPEPGSNPVQGRLLQRSSGTGDFTQKRATRGARQDASDLRPAPEGALRRSAIAFALTDRYNCGATNPAKKGQSKCLPGHFDKNNDAQ